MEKQYYITIGDEQVPVSAEVYYEYRRPAWREAKRRKVRSEHERSIEKFMDDGLDITDGQPSIDDLVADMLELERLAAALAELTADERAIVDALFYQDKSEREVAALHGVSQQAINKHRKKILSKLRDLLR